MSKKHAIAEDTALRQIRRAKRLAFIEGVTFAVAFAAVMFAFGLVLGGL